MRRPPIRSRAAAALAALTLAGSGVLAATTATASAPAASTNSVPNMLAAPGPQDGKVVTRSTPLDIREKPDPGSRIVGELRSGATVRLKCWESGGTYQIPNYTGGNQFWYKLAGRSGYVTAQYVYVKPNSLDNLPNCYWTAAEGPTSDH